MEPEDGALPQGGGWGWTCNEDSTRRTHRPTKTAAPGQDQEGRGGRALRGKVSEGVGLRKRALYLHGAQSSESRCPVSKDRGETMANTKQTQSP